MINNECIFYECKSTVLLHLDRFQHTAYSTQFGFVEPNLCHALNGAQYSLLTNFVYWIVGYSHRSSMLHNVL